MKLSNEYRYSVLCEDAQTRSFIQAFLDDQGIGIRRIHFNMAPAGDGCGSQYVRKYYPSEVRTILSMNYQKLVLIVCMDADNYSVLERKMELDEQLKSDFCADSRYQANDLSKECIIVWIPKRQIENWIHFLRNEETNEDIDYKHGGKPEKCKFEASILSKYFQGAISIEKEILSSIKFAKEEYDRVCELQAERL